MTTMTKSSRQQTIFIDKNEIKTHFKRQVDDVDYDEL